MIRTSLCLAAVALLCGTSAIAQTTGGTSGGSSGSSLGGQSGSATTQQPSDPMGPMPEQQGPMGAEPGQSGSMGSQPGEQPWESGQGQDASGSQQQQDRDAMDSRQEQGSAAGQSAMQGQQSENFAAFDANNDGALDRTEFARALDVMAEPAAGGQKTTKGSAPKGDRAISPLNQTSLEFQRADTNGDGRISPEEFSSYSPQQQQ